MLWPKGGHINVVPLYWRLGMEGKTRQPWRRVGCFRMKYKMKVSFICYSQPSWSLDYSYNNLLTNNLTVNTWMKTHRHIIPLPNKEEHIFLSSIGWTTCERPADIVRHRYLLFRRGYHRHSCFFNRQWRFLTRYGITKLTQTDAAKSPIQ